MGVASFAIRDARREDAGALADLVDQLGYPNSSDSIAGRLGPMAECGNRVLVAELDGRIVGCLTTSILRVIHRPAPVGRISMMVVEAGLRGSGIGRALVAAAEAALREAGCYMIEVTSRFDRERAHAFYERLGYEKTSVRLARTL